MNEIIINKKRIVWITPDCFFDVDWPIVGGLIDNYDIKWYVLWSPNCNRTLPQNANITKFIRLKYSWYDPRNIWESYSITKMIGKEDAKLVYNGNNGFPAFFPLLFKRVPAERIIYEGHEIDNEIQVLIDEIIDLSKKLPEEAGIEIVKKVAFT